MKTSFQVAQEIQSLISVGVEWGVDVGQESSNIKEVIDEHVKEKLENMLHEGSMYLLANDTRDDRKPVTTFELLDYLKKYIAK